MGGSRWRRRLPVGAEVQADDLEHGVHFRVWAPGHESLEVVWDRAMGANTVGGSRVLEPEPGGYFASFVERIGVGVDYRYRVDGALLPDPASRFQPEGPFGPSRVIDPGSFAWTDEAWNGPRADDAVIYELHVGTFTPAGTWRDAEAQLPYLSELGVSVIEVLPVGDFPGRFGWGYDGVNLFAPTRLYGLPDDMRRFVDRAHGHGLAVILDVIYNHLGPDGNFLGHFSDRYFSTIDQTEWGPAINFKGADSGPVREYYLANAGYWIDEFHLDGLRIDATQSIFDDDQEHEHILTAIGRHVRQSAGGRSTMLIAESEHQDPRLVRPLEQGGHGLDAVWSEDFHHAALVAATGRREAYYADYHGSPQELVSLARYGFLYQGQWNPRQGKRRGWPSWDLTPNRFVNYLQNHDQVANSPRGQRIQQLTDPGRLRALTAFLLLAPETPMVFQGQEFAASSSFHYFGDQKPELAERMLRGRQDFLSQFPSMTTRESKESIVRPDDPEVFQQSKLDHTERLMPGHAEVLALHMDLIRLRRDDPTLSACRTGRGRIDGAVLGPHAFLIRWFGETIQGSPSADRIFLINLGIDLDLCPASEPLLAPPGGSIWELAWSSEEPRYGGGGVIVWSATEDWRVTGHSAALLVPANPA